MLPSVSVFWFRRDLRLDDNAGLYHALKGAHPVLPLFIFDRNILDEIPKKDARVEFIHQTVADLKHRIETLGGSMLVRYGKPEQVWPQILQEFTIGAVYTNRDYEPYALSRDAGVADLLAEKNIPLHTFKDHVIFEKDEVLKADGTPYTVFTPYSKKWLEKLQSRWGAGEAGGDRVSFYLSSYPNERYFDNFLKTAPLTMPDLAGLGFQPAGIAFPPATVTRGLIKNYDRTRDFPAQNGTSRLGLHFRFGIVVKQSHLIS